MIPVNPKETDSIKEVSLDASALDDLEKQTKLNEASPNTLNPGTIAMPSNQTYRSSRLGNNVRIQTAITAKEFAEGKVTTKTVNAGVLQFTMTLEGVKLRNPYGEPAFDRESLRIRVSVRPITPETNRGSKKD